MIHFRPNFELTSEPETPIMPSKFSTLRWWLYKISVTWALKASVVLAGSNNGEEAIYSICDEVQLFGASLVLCLSLCLKNVKLSNSNFTKFTS